MAAEFPVRAVLDDEGIKRLIAELRKAGKEAGLTEEEISDMNSELDKTGKEGVKNVNSVNGSLNNMVKDGLSRVSKALIGLLALNTLKNIAKDVINVTGEFQKFEAVLTNTLGSNSKARRALNEISDFASKTPFSVRELTDSFIRLANQGFIPTMEEMRKLGDVAASTGKTFIQLTEAIIDAQTGEFERLKEFGIRAQKEGEKVKFTFKGVKTEVDFTNESIRNYILSLGELEGVTGATEAISNTFAGTISNIGDNLDQLANNFGKYNKGPIADFFKLIGAGLEGFNKILADANLEVTDFAEIRLERFRKKFDDISKTVGGAEFKGNFDDLNLFFQDLTNAINSTNEEIRDLSTVHQMFEEGTDEFKRQATELGILNAELEGYKEIREDLLKVVEQYKEKGKVTEKGLIETLEGKIKSLNEELKKATTEKEIGKINQQLARFNEELQDLRNLGKDGLIEDIERQIKKLQQQLSTAKTVREIEALNNKIVDLTIRLNFLRQAGTNLFRDAFPVEKLKEFSNALEEHVGKGAEKATDRFEREMKRRAKLEDESIKKTIDVEEQRRGIYEASFDLISTLANGYAQLVHANNMNELSDLEAQKEYELSLTGDNARSREQIEKDFDNRKKELMRKQAQRDRENTIFNIILNTASAVVEALPNYILAAAATATGIVQLGIASSAPIPKFAKGKYKIPGLGTRTSDSIPALLSRDESVVSADKSDKFGWLLKPIIENDLTVADVKKLVDAHMPPELRGDLWRPAPATDSHRLENKMDEMIKVVKNKSETYIDIDENGFSKWTKKGIEWTEYLNSRYSA